MHGNKKRSREEADSSNEQKQKKKNNNNNHNDDHKANAHDANNTSLTTHPHHSLDTKDTKLRDSQEIKTITTSEHARRVSLIAASAKTLLNAVGEDPEREGLIKTPQRYAEAMLFFTKGYETTLAGKFFSPVLFKLRFAFD